jgi:ribosome-associated protein
MDDLVVGGHTIPAEELIETFELSGGPGGQHANRNATAVRLRLDTTTSSLPEDVRTKLQERVGATVEVIAADSRSQWRNRAIARRRLKEKIEATMVERPERRPSQPTRASKRRRLQSKRARAETKRLRKPPTSHD